MMTTMRRLHFLLLSAIPIALAAHARPAEAATDCSTLQNVLYLQVGDTQVNLMKQLGRKLRDNTGKPITLAWVTGGSCTNITLMYTQNARVTKDFDYVPSTAEVPTWDGTTLKCTPPNPAGAGTPGVFPDIGNSALFNSACPGGDTPPNTLALTLGPRQAYVLAVPEGSTQTAITFEEAYYVFGFGAAGMISPWMDETQIFIRTATKSTQVAWAKSLGVPPDKFKGVPNDGSPAVVTSVANAQGPNIEKAIGLLGAEVYDNTRATLNILAYRAPHQWAAYYPDSTSSSRDKKNVRDGHYTVWSPTVWMDYIDATSGDPVKPDTRYVIDLISGQDVTPAPNFDANEVIARVGLVPDCAMRVTRDFEGGPLRRYTPATSCTCKFESIVDATACDTCTDTCPGTKVCRQGFCEEF